MVISPAANTNWPVSNCRKKYNPTMKLNFTSTYAISLGLLGSQQAVLDKACSGRLVSRRTVYTSWGSIPLVHEMSNSCQGERHPKGRRMARCSCTTSSCSPFTHPLQPLPGSPDLHYRRARCHCTNLQVLLLTQKIRRQSLVLSISSCFSLSSASPLFAWSFFDLLYTCVCRDSLYWYAVLLIRSHKGSSALAKMHSRVFDSTSLHVF